MSKEDWTGKWRLLSSDVGGRVFAMNIGGKTLIKTVSITVQKHYVAAHCSAYTTSEMVSENVVAIDEIDLEAEIAKVQAAEKKRTRAAVRNMFKQEESRKARL